MQNNFQEPIFRIDTKCYKKYTVVFPGIVFHRGRDDRKKGESAEAKLLEVESTEKHIPENTSFYPENHNTKNQRFCKVLWPA